MKPLLSLRLLIPLILLVTFGLTVWFNYQGAFERAKEAAVDELARHIGVAGPEGAHMLGRFVADGDALSAKGLIRILAGDTHADIVLLVDEREEILFSLGGDGNGKNLETTSPPLPLAYIRRGLAERGSKSRIVETPPRYQSLFPARLGPNRWGVLYIENDLTPALTQARSEIGKNHLILTMVLAGSTLLVWFLLSLLVTRRVERLVALTEQVADGDYSGRVADGGSDELARLGSAFNRMSDHLERVTDELFTAREPFALLARLSPVGIFSIDPQGNVTYANEYLLDIAKPNDIRPEKNVWATFVHPDDRQEVLDEWERVIALALPFDREFRVLDAQGEVRWLSAQASPHIDDGGNLSGYLGAAFDITERRETEQRLRQWADLFEVAEWGMATWRDGDQGLQLVNRAFAQMVGADVETMRHNPIVRWIAPEAKDDFIERIGQVREMGYVMFETVLLDPDGEHLPAMASVTAMVDEKKGDLTYSLNVQNILARKASEESLIRLATAVEQTDEMVMIADVEGVIEYVNPAFSAVTGYTPDELIGSTPRLIKSGRHDREYYAGLWSTILAGNVWHGRFANKKKSGEMFEVESIISPVTGPDGTIINFVCLQRDVTREVRMEKQVRQNQKMQAVGTLAGGIAHDFNNILTAIMGYAELALEDAGSNPNLKDDINEIFTASRRAKDLVGQILTFSRGRESETRPVELHLLVKETLRFLAASLPSTITLEERIDTTGDTVLADPSQLSQVILNLCANAEYAMRKKGGRLSVIQKPHMIDESFTATHMGLRTGPHVLLQIVDTGVGMAKEIQDRLFEPFFTTKPQGEGTGLGLSVVHGIVSTLGGAITVESVPNAGTTFSVYLPVVDQISDVEMAEMEETPGSWGKGSIMVVDDEETITRMMERMLGGMGYRITSFNDPVEGLKAFYNAPQSFDIVITDQTMPQLTGVEMTRRMLAERPDLPVILCTGHSYAVDEESAKAAGIKVFLMKPTARSVWRDTIQGLLS